MERSVFAERMERSANRARDFAREYVVDPLPYEIRFCVSLNASYDGNPLHPDERVYPDDLDKHDRAKLASLDLERFVDLVWRDGAVPEWIDFSVVDADHDATLIEALVCGRFTANESLLYHEREGSPPFHVVSPALPPGWEQGSPRFRLRWRTPNA